MESQLREKMALMERGIKPMDMKSLRSEVKKLDSGLNEIQQEELQARIKNCEAMTFHIGHLATSSDAKGFSAYAKGKKEPIGFLAIDKGFKTVPSNASEHVLLPKIEGVVTHPFSKLAGIRLTECAVQQSKEWGHSGKLYLHAVHGSDEFYKKLGFVEIEEKSSDYDSDDSDEEKSVKMMFDPSTRPDIWSENDNQLRVTKYLGQEIGYREP
ncbi:MAG TPA: hypothetical protein VM571_04180 [Noviherbaspirillum sp.]|nr:hypothetical protein [Noviherbaspirillum sp.]